MPTRGARHRPTPQNKNRLTLLYEKFVGSSHNASSLKKDETGVRLQEVEAAGHERGALLGPAGAGHEANGFLFRAFARVRGGA